VTSPPPAPPLYRAGPQNFRADNSYVDIEEARPAALTWNPLDILWGRLSINMELLAGVMHHAFVASLHTLVFNDSRGSSKNLISEGFGFATQLSSELGGELGYHYWFSPGYTLRGFFAGPSILIGGTSRPAVADINTGRGYFGAALDGGWQAVFDGGFTVGFGAGLGVLHMASTTAAFPRLLGQVGYSF
jgi:hypothetical protein